MSQRQSKIKKSIIFSGLIGSGGFFIAKFIGLFYAIPLSDILGSDAYMAYYGSAYRIYSYLLNIFTAGFPFAIATLVAKYMLLEQYKTVLYIKRISTLFMTLLGALGMVIMMALAGVIAPVITEEPSGIQTMTMVLCILALAIFLVPILSAYRGFIQGCKEMKEYAFSQAYEQIFRVGFLLSVSCLAVYLFKMARVWALYAAVLSTSVAAIAGIMQIYGFAARSEKSIAKAAGRKPEKKIRQEALIKEFFLLAIPYMISAVLGYSDDIYNTILLPIGLKVYYSDPQEINTVMSAVNYAGSKLNAIPMVLAPGFTAAIVPHISAALAGRDYKTIRKNVRDCINIVLFIGLFVSFAIFLYAAPVFYSLFYTQDLPLSAYITRWIAIEGFLGTITPVVASLMMALRLQKSLLKRLVVQAVVKGILLIPFTMWMGFPGAVLATMISYFYILLMNMAEIGIRFKVSYASTLQVLVKTAIGLVCMSLCAWLLSRLNLGSTDGSRLMCFLGLMVNGLAATLIFAGVEIALGVPQFLFHIRLGRRKAAAKSR